MMLWLLKLLGGHVDWIVEYRALNLEFKPLKQGFTSRAEAYRYLKRYRHPDIRYRILARVTFHLYCKEVP